MMKILSQSKCFDGQQMICSHESKILGCLMRFAIFIPLQTNTTLPALYWLSGLTCNEENFTFKAGAQRFAAELGLILVIPDTSPRGLGIKGEDDAIDFGTGAGFYLDAICEPWSKNYKMYSYITQELQTLVEAAFPINPQCRGILGHSMGGHGALTIALKNPQQYQSVSAFAPICSPMSSPWGEKALKGYLGTDKSTWQDYDACELIRHRGWQGPEILIDQGTADPFLKDQLKPELLESACQQAQVPLRLRMQEGYDHSYYFIATFIQDHLAFHAKNLHRFIKQS